METNIHDYELETETGEETTDDKKGKQKDGKETADKKRTQTAPKKRETENGK